MNSLSEAPARSFTATSRSDTWIKSARIGSGVFTGRWRCRNGIQFARDQRSGSPRACYPISSRKSECRTACGSGCEVFVRARRTLTAPHPPGRGPGRGRATTTRRSAGESPIGETGGHQRKSPHHSVRASPVLVGAIGLEPTTPTMSRWCSNQLSYAPEGPRIMGCCPRHGKPHPLAGGHTVEIPDPVSGRAARPGATTVVNRGCPGIRLG